MYSHDCWKHASIRRYSWAQHSCGGTIILSGNRALGPTVKGTPTMQKSLKDVILRAAGREEEAVVTSFRSWPPPPMRW